MGLVKDDDQRQLQKILRGAFSGSPTPLKDIPTRFGEKRKTGEKAGQRKRRRQRKNRAA